MAVSGLARRALAPAAMAAARKPDGRLAPAKTPPASVTVSPVSDRLRGIELPQRPQEAAAPVRERAWLGTPMSIRLPHMNLPRLSLPQLGSPHWKSMRVPQLPVSELAELGAGAAQLLTLWNGPNVEDIRRFEGNANAPYSYGWFQNLLTECARVKTTDARQQFLDVFGKYGSPKLTNELAALEYFCMKTAYLKLQPGDKHRFCCADYGTQMVVRSIRDYDTGLVAHVMEPEEASAAAAAPDADASAPASKPPVLIVFRGTARASNQPETELTERPTGCQADLDWDGIGYKAFAENRDELLGIVRGYMAQGHRVILAGHSLGGVFAARTMCALTPDEQRMAFLRTFNASGLDPETRVRAVVPEHNLMVRHRDDKLPRAGGELLDGTLITTIPQNSAEALYPHGMPLMAANGLNGHPIKITRKKTEPSDMSPTLELGRKFLSVIAHDRVDV